MRLLNYNYLRQETLKLLSTRIETDSREYLVINIQESRAISQHVSRGYMQKNLGENCREISSPVKVESKECDAFRSTVLLLETRQDRCGCSSYKGF